MDWTTGKREGDQLVENWVFVDMIHLFRQLGVDLFERLAAARESRAAAAGSKSSVAG